MLSISLDFSTGMRQFDNTSVIFKTRGAALKQVCVCVYVSLYLVYDLTEGVQAYAEQQGGRTPPWYISHLIDREIDVDVKTMIRQGNSFQCMVGFSLSPA